MPDLVALPITGAAAVDRLRELATRYAKYTLDPIAKPRAKFRWEDKLVGICTAIEVLTVYGNYAMEMANAQDRARAELIAKGVLHA